MSAFACERTRGGEPEIGVGAVIGLPRHRRDRLDVDAHMVHVGDALLGRIALGARPLAVLPVDRPALVARRGFEKPARDFLVAFDEGDLHGSKSLVVIGHALGLGRPADRSVPQNALKRLRERQILIRTEKGLYRFEDEAFKDWVQSEHPEM